ncbi:hypothetical protein [Clostridium sp. ZBS18]|uniref:hypothetical protein n=1 Tax=Clostridium sp. ZBS18 TaxID=2949967 RepID=UPI00207963DC|nr:hypothetical protein [Clostridium sp. ZBS18]
MKFVIVNLRKAFNRGEIHKGVLLKKELNFNRKVKINQHTADYYIDDNADELTIHFDLR